MKQIIETLMYLFRRKKPVISKKSAVEYSVDKYGKAYKLLEKYDQSTKKEAPSVADPEKIERYFHQV